MREPRGSVLLALLAGAAGVTLHQNAHQGLFESADSPHLFINGSGFDVGVLGDLEFKPTLKRDFDYEIVSHGATWIKLRRLPPRTWWSGHYSTEPSWTQPAELLLMSIELGGVNYGATGGVTIATIFSDPHVVYGATPVHAHPNANVPAQEYFDSLPQITQEVNEQYEDAQSVDAPVLEKDIFEDVVDEYELHNPSPFAKLSVRCSGLDAGAVALDLDPVPSGDYTVTVASDGTALEIALTSPGAAWCAPERCPDSPAETVPLIVRGVSTSQRGAITFLHPVVVATIYHDDATLPPPSPTALPIPSPTPIPTALPTSMPTVTSEDPYVPPLHTTHVHKSDDAGAKALGITVLCCALLTLCTACAVTGRVLYKKLRLRMQPAIEVYLPLNVELVSS